MLNVYIMRLKFNVVGICKMNSSTEINYLSSCEYFIVFSSLAINIDVINGN